MENRVSTALLTRKRAKIGEVQPNPDPRFQARMQKRHNHDRPIERAVRRLVRQYKAASDRIERREHGRTHFIRQVKAVADNGRDYTVLTRDISLSARSQSACPMSRRLILPIGDSRTLKYARKSPHWSEWNPL